MTDQIAGLEKRQDRATGTLSYLTLPYRSVLSFFPALVVVRHFPVLHFLSPRLRRGN